MTIWSFLGLRRLRQACGTSTTSLLRNESDQNRQVNDSNQPLGSSIRGCPDLSRIASFANIDQPTALFGEVSKESYYHPLHRQKKVEEHDCSTANVASITYLFSRQGHRDQASPMESASDRGGERQRSTCKRKAWGSSPSVARKSCFRNSSLLAIKCLERVFSH